MILLTEYGGVLSFRRVPNGTWLGTTSPVIIPRTRICSLKAKAFKYILVIRDSQVLAKLGAVTIFFIGWGQTARLQRVRQNTADRIQTETEQQQTARLQRVRQNTADRILKFDKRYKAFEIAGYFQKHRELIG